MRMLQTLATGECNCKPTMIFAGRKMAAQVKATIESHLFIISNCAHEMMRLIFGWPEGKSKHRAQRPLHISLYPFIAVEK